MGEDLRRRRDGKVKEVGRRREPQQDPRHMRQANIFPFRWMVTSGAEPSLVFISWALINTTGLRVLRRRQRKIEHCLRARWAAAPKHYYTPTPTFGPANERTTDLAARLVMPQAPPGPDK